MEEERRRFGCQKASTESNRWWCGGGGGSKVCLARFNSYLSQELCVVGQPRAAPVQPVEAGTRPKSVLDGVRQHVHARRRDPRDPRALPQGRRPGPSPGPRPAGLQRSRGLHLLGEGGRRPRQIIFHGGSHSSRCSLPPQALRSLSLRSLSALSASLSAPGRPRSLASKEPRAPSHQHATPPFLLEENLWKTLIIGAKKRRRQTDAG